MLDGKYTYYFHKWDPISKQFLKKILGSFTVENDQVTTVEGDARDFLKVGPIDDTVTRAVKHEMSNAYHSVELSL